MWKIEKYQFDNYVCMYEWMHINVANVCILGIDKSLGLKIEYETENDSHS